MKRNLVLATCVATTLVASGCASMTEEQKRSFGQMTGAITGAAIAVAATKGVDNDLLRGALIIAGASAGAYIGDQFAKMLSERDQQRLYEAQQRVALTDKPVEFTGDDGVEVKVSVVADKPATVEQRVVEVQVLKDRIDKTPPLQLVNTPHSATSNLNLRGGPGTDYRVVGSVPANQVVKVIGQVKGEPWYLVSQSDNGVATGYASSKYLIRTDKAVDTIDVGAQEVASLQVDAASVCKTVRQEANSKGQVVTQDIRICQQGNGSWKMA